MNAEALLDDLGRKATPDPPPAMTRDEPFATSCRTLLPSVAITLVH